MNRIKLIIVAIMRFFGFRQAPYEMEVVAPEIISKHFGKEYLKKGAGLNRTYKIQSENIPAGTLNEAQNSDVSFIIAPSIDTDNRISPAFDFDSPMPFSGGGFSGSGAGGDWNSDPGSGYDSGSSYDSSPNPSDY